MYNRWLGEDEGEFTQKQRDQLECQARQMLDLAFSVGEKWNPPEPEEITLIGFLGRMEEEGAKRDMTMKSIEKYPSHP